MTIDTGSTVTATYESISMTGTSVNGVCTLVVPSYGTWAIEATLDGKTAYASVEIDAAKQYAVTMKYDPSAST